MADEQNTNAEAQAGNANAAPQIRINAQYIKDLSFENPNAPGVLANPPQDTGLNVNVNVEAGRMDGSTYEVTTKFDIRASSGDKTVFIIELAYAGVFTLTNVPDEHHEAACLIECPRLVFPFARRIIADLTRDGGFMPLMLDPIDFMRLYQQNRANQQAAPAN